MNTISNLLKQVSRAQTVTVGDLSLNPLLYSPQSEPEYLTLDEVLARGDVGVTESTEATEVPRLLFESRGKHSVLLVACGDRRQIRLTP